MLQFNSEINLTKSLLDIYGDSTFKAFWMNSGEFLTQKSDMIDLYLLMHGHRKRNDSQFLLFTAISFEVWMIQFHI